MGTGMVMVVVAVIVVVAFNSMALAHRSEGSRIRRRWIWCIDESDILQIKVEIIVRFGIINQSTLQS